MNATAERAKSIFMAILRQVPPDHWPLHLEVTCAGDAELRRELESLLSAHLDGDSFLATPAAAVVVTAEDAHVITADAGTSIGPYKIRERIGEGGMGEVYVAEQSEPVRRKVALKIIRPGMATKDIVARFEAERQALAMMDHPHIARVFDGGATDAGQPYFVMELVQGPPITDYCDQHRLSTTARLRLFVTVCGAVHHAHQKGIIHRDLKPSNIMVPEIDGTAVPKVIDFGVAKAIHQKLTENTIYTHFAQVVGTPLYMSPEQAGLGVVDIDTRSDVYSLGVLLYELLAGSTPFDTEAFKKAGFDEMRRMIREDQPRRPSMQISTLEAQALSTVAELRSSDPRRLSASLAGELDWIVMKALEKDRNRRYESAGALAADIERYLVGEAVEASPPSAAYRFKKFAQRNRVLLTTSALFMAALLLGIAGTSWQAWRATRALATAERNMEAADKNLRLAESERANALASFRSARDTVDKFLARIEKDELLQNPEMHSLRGQLLNVAREYYRQFVDEHKNNPALQKDLAESYRSLGDIAWTVGDRDTSDEAHKKAIAILALVAEANPNDDELRHELAAMALAVASVSPFAREENLKKAVETAKSLTKPAHRLTYAKACSVYADWLLHGFQGGSGDPQLRETGRALAVQSEQVYLELLKMPTASDEVQIGLADVSIVLAKYFQDREEFTKAAEYRARSCQALEQLVEKHPNNADYRLKLVYAYAQNAQIDKAIDVVRQLADQQPSVVRYQKLLGDLYRSRHTDHDSVKRAVEITGKLYERYPNNYELAADFGVSLRYLGKIERTRGDFTQAIKSYEAAIERLSETKPYLIGQLSSAFVNLRDVYRATGDIQAETEAAQAVLKINREMRDSFPNPTYVSWGAYAHLYLAGLFARTGRLEEAIEQCEAALELIGTVFRQGKAPDTAMRAIADARFAHRDGLHDLGRYLQLQGKQTDAADIYRRAIDAEAQLVRDVPRSLGHKSPNPLYDAFISLSRQTGQNQQVEQLLRAELTTWQELEQQSAFKFSCQNRQLEIQLRLAEHLLACDRADEAATYYRQGRSLLESMPGELHKAIATCVHVCPTQPPVALPECPERHELLAAVQKGLWSALTEAREESDDEKWELWSELALAYYGPLQWQGAEKEAPLSLQMAANDPQHLAMVVPLMLLAGQKEQYRELCQRLLECPQHQRGPALQGTLHLCLLDPDPADPEKLLDLARAATRGLSDTLLVDVALYRAGKYEQAIQGLERGLASGRHPRALVELHLALAHSLAKDNEHAQAWLEKGIADWEPNWAPREKLSYEVLRQELFRQTDDTPTEETAADERNIIVTSPATVAE